MLNLSTRRYLHLNGGGFFICERDLLPALAGPQALPLLLGLRAILGLNKRTLRHHGWFGNSLLNTYLYSSILKNGIEE